MEMLVSSRESKILGVPEVLTNFSLELVVGSHHKLFNTKMTAFTKWCPEEEEDKSFERAEKAIDLALTRMGQKQIALLQCRTIPLNSSIESY